MTASNINDVFGHHAFILLLPLEKMDDYDFFELQTELTNLTEWFLRLAAVTRMLFIEKLLNKIEDINIIGKILKYLQANFPMECVYLGQRDTEKNMYDKVLIDDNRTLSVGDCNVMYKKLLAWFCNLTQQQQFEIILELCNVGGGALICNLYHYVFHLWKERMCQSKDEQDQLMQIEIPEEALRIHFHLPSIFPQFQTKSFSIELLKAPIKRNLNALDTTAIQEANIRWETLIKAFRKKAGIPEPGVRPKSKSTKKSKKTKLTRKEKNRLDYVQMLPIWINRRIVRMLDPDSLKAAKRVNKYWHYLVEEVEEEMLLRIQLDAIARKTKQKDAKTKAKRKKRVLVKSVEMKFDLAEPKDPQPFEYWSDWYEDIFSIQKNISLRKYALVRIFTTCNNACRISVDSNYRCLVAHQERNVIRLYSLITFASLYEPLQLLTIITTCAVHSELNRLQLGFNDGSLQSCRLRDTVVLTNYYGHNTSISCISLGDDYMVSSSDNLLMVHDILSGLIMGQVEINLINCLEAVPNTVYFYAGLKSGHINKYFAMNCQLVETIPAHIGYITDIKAGLYVLASCGVDRSVRIWSYFVMDKGCLQNLEHHTIVTCVAMYNKYLFSGTINGFIYIWNYLRGTKLQILKIRDDLEPIKQVFSYFQYGRIKVVFIIGLEVKVIEFKEDKKFNLKRNTNTPVGLCRGGNIFTTPEPVGGLTDVNALRLNRKEQRLELLKYRGCVDRSLRKISDDNILYSVTHSLYSDLFYGLNSENLRNCIHFFSRSLPIEDKYYNLPQILQSEDVQLPDSEAEKRFDKKTMLQVYHPYNIVI